MLEQDLSGCGAVGLAHLLWEQGVLRSSRSTPTTTQDRFHTMFFWPIAGSLQLVFFLLKILKSNRGVPPESDTLPVHGFCALCAPRSLY